MPLSPFVPSFFLSSFLPSFLPFLFFSFLFFLSFPFLFFHNYRLYRKVARIIQRIPRYPPPTCPKYKHFTFALSFSLSLNLQTWWLFTLHFTVNFLKIINYNFCTMIPISNLILKQHCYLIVRPYWDFINFPNNALYGERKRKPRCCLELSRLFRSLPPATVPEFFLCISWCWRFWRGQARYFVEWRTLQQCLPCNWPPNKCYHVLSAHRVLGSSHTLSFSSLQLRFEG